MSAKISLALLCLVSVSACAAPSQIVRPQTALITTAPVGSVLTGAPGEVVYRAAVDRYRWELIFEDSMEIGPYFIEAGSYEMSGVGRNGYFFDVGDGCAGDPAVTASRFASAPEYLLLSEDQTRVCVTNPYDPARCAAFQGALEPVDVTEGDDLTYRLVYDGSEDAEDGTVMASFTLFIERAGDMRERTIVRPAPGPLEIGRGRFQILSADAQDVELQLDGAFVRTPPLELPTF